MRAHRFPLFQADFSGFSLISSIAAISSFSVGILIIPTAVKEISIGTCFKPSSPFSLLWTSIRLIKVFTMVGVNSFKSVHSRIASSKNLQINLFLFGFSDCLLVVFKLRRAVGISDSSIYPQIAEMTARLITFLYFADSHKPCGHFLYSGQI